MYQVVIIPKDTAANCALAFKTKEKALETYNRIVAFINGGVMPGIDNPGFCDDYGYLFCIRPTDICYMLFVDVYESQMLQFDKNMVMDKAAQAIDKKLRELGFKNPPPSERSRIIQ